MIEWILFFLIHISYWGCGSFLILICHPSARILSVNTPHWFASWAIGLALNVILAFIANQFFEVQVRLPVLLLIAVAIFAPLAIFRKTRSVASETDNAAVNWSWSDIVLAIIVGLVWAYRHAIDSPLTDWDSLMYHLPFGRTISNGSFPSDLGRSYILQMEAAYPPLFYFLYGLNASIHSPDITFLAPRIQVAIVNGLTCVTTWQLAKTINGLSNKWSLIAALGTACVMNREPNVQSLTTLFVSLGLIYSWNAFRPKNEAGDKSHLLAAVVLSGGYWTTYLALPLVGLFLGSFFIVHVWCLFKRYESPVDLRRLFVCAVFFTLTITPHFLRNWLSIGNPIYPALPDILGGVDITDWFLTNRPIAATPMNQNWTFLPMSLVMGSPNCQILLAGIAALFGTTHMPREQRMISCIMLAGFFIVWFELFHLNNSSIHRYLYPVLPMAIVCVVKYVAEPTEKRPLLMAIRSIWMLGFIPLLSTEPYPQIVVFALLPVLLFGPMFLSGHVGKATEKSSTLSDSPWRCLIPFGIAIVSFVSLSNWQTANRSALNIQRDIDWLNKNLNEDDLVLVFDGRLFTFEHQFVALDDIRLEPFVRASDHNAVAELKQLGVTHFYCCFESAYLLSDAMSNRINESLVPTAENSAVKTVYGSPSGWIVRLADD